MTVSATPLTKFFANSKALGFTVITKDRPFHLFAEDPKTRLEFLCAFSSVNEISTKPKLHELINEKGITFHRQNSRTSTIATSVIEEMEFAEDASLHRNCIKVLTKRRIKIIPYKTKETFDNISIEDRPKSRIKGNSSIRAHSLGPTQDNPFTLTETGKPNKLITKDSKEVLKTDKKELEELYGVSRTKVPVGVVIEKLQAEAEELQREINTGPSKQVHKVYRRPAKIYYRRNTKPKEEFEYNW